MCLTSGSDKDIISYLRTHHRGAIPGPTQPAFPFNPATWNRYLPGTLGPTVLDLPQQLGGLISRTDLLALATNGTGRTELRRLFVACLIWGTGTSNARLLPGFTRACGHRDLDRALTGTSRLIRKGRPGDAYELWEQYGVPGLDEPFFTKWLFAAGLAGVPDGYLKPLVLDTRVWKSLGALGWSSEQASGFKRRGSPAAAYCAYLAAADRWAHGLSTKRAVVTSEDIELFLFRTKLPSS
jgi:hypothetical protein